MATFIIYADAVPDSLGGWVDDTFEWVLPSPLDGTIRFVCTGLCVALNGDPTPIDPATLGDLLPATAQVHFMSGAIQAACQAARQFDVGTDEGLVNGPVVYDAGDFAYPGPIPSIATLAAGGIGIRGVTSSGGGGVVFVGYAGFGGDVRIIGTTVVPTITPDTGGTLGADPVTIAGAGFTGATGVTFDGTAATDVVAVSDTTITCLTPAHAVGLVDVVVTRSDTSTVTLTDGFRYTLGASTPTVDAGQAQVALGPLPSVVTTVATVTRGLNNGSLTYLWTPALDNPADVTFGDATLLNTTITFDAFVAGVYHFEIAVTDEAAFFTATDLLTVTMGPTVPPRVSSGSVQVAG